MELFFNGQRMLPARWPNVNASAVELRYVRVGSVVAADDMAFGCGPDAGTAHPLDTHAPGACATAHGYFRNFHFGWQDEYAALASIVKANESYVLAQSLHYMPPYPGQRYFVLNLIEELHLASGSMTQTLACCSSIRLQLHLLLVTLPVKMQVLLLQPCRRPPFYPLLGRHISHYRGLITLQPNTAHLHFTRLHSTTARGTALLGGVDNHNIGVTNCTFDAGAGTVVTFAASNSTAGPLSTHNNSLAGLNISSMGAGGVILDCGVRTTLTRGNCKLYNTIVTKFSEWKYTYSFAVELDGVLVPM